MAVLEAFKALGLFLRKEEQGFDPLLFIKKIRHRNNSLFQ